MSSVCVKFSKKNQFFLWDYTYFFHWYLYLVVRADVMVGSGVFSVTNLGDVAVILHATLSGSGVSTLGGACYPTLLSVDVCTTLGGASGLSRQVWLQGCKLS